MNWLKRIIINWAHKQMNAGSVARAPETASDEPNNFSMTVMNAMNGKVIQIRTYQPQRHGPDWRTEYFIVADGERLSDAVTMLLMAKNLEKA